MTWEVKPGSRWRIVAERRGAQLAELVATADAAGRLSARIDVPAQEPLDLRLACHG